jgi:hypothetical protein
MYAASRITANKPHYVQFIYAHLVADVDHDRGKRQHGKRKYNNKHRRHPAIFRRAKKAAALNQICRYLSIIVYTNFSTLLRTQDYSAAPKRIDSNNRIIDHVSDSATTYRIEKPMHG